MAGKKTTDTHAPFLFFSLPFSLSFLSKSQSYHVRVPPLWPHFTLIISKDPISRDSHTDGQGFNVKILGRPNSVHSHSQVIISLLLFETVITLSLYITFLLTISLSFLGKQKHLNRNSLIFSYENLPHDSYNFLVFALDDVSWPKTSWAKTSMVFQILVSDLVSRIICSQILYFEFVPFFCYSLLKFSSELSRAAAFTFSTHILS